jgi:hypothetical protein
VRDKATVGVYPLLDVGQIPAVDDPIKALGPADQHAGLAAGKCVGHQFPRRLRAGMAIEEFDVAGGMS